jgi:hypothetical protein
VAAIVDESIKIGWVLNESMNVSVLMLIFIDVFDVIICFAAISPTSACNVYCRGRLLFE